MTIRILIVSTPGGCSGERRSEKRRKPRQKRAQATLGLMFKAAIRVITSHGHCQAHHAAGGPDGGPERGARLYQYFGNKQSLLMALAEREFAGTSKAVLEAVAAAMQVPGADLDAAPSCALLCWFLRRPVYFTPHCSAMVSGSTTVNCPRRLRDSGRLTEWQLEFVDAGQTMLAAGGVPPTAVQHPLFEEIADPSDSMTAFSPWI